MSVLNIYVEQDRADIWTDGAYVNPDWTVKSFASKSLILGAVPAVIAVCGPGNLGILAHLALHDRFANFDEMEEGVIEALRAVPEFQGPDATFVLVWSGWSQRHGRVKGFAVSPSGAIPGLEAWERGEVQRWLMPNPPGFVVSLKRFGVDVTAREPILTTDAHRIVMEQRALRGLIPEYPEANAIGGFLQQTVIQKSGITTRIAHRWTEDRIGERITPSA